MILALVACSSGVGAGEWPVADFLADGVHLEHALLDAPDGPVTVLETAETAWEIRDTNDAVVDSFTADLSDGLLLDGEPILPSILAVGEAGVTALGEHETWYGTFPRAVTVEIADGRWAGTQVFAEDLGPVTYTLDGQVWDLVFYDRSAE